MKNRFVLLGVLALNLFVFAPKMTAAASEVVVRFAEFNGRPLELLLNIKTKEVYLRLSHTNTMLSDPEIIALKAEVLRLVSLTNTTALGETGLSFRYSGGYPMWAPCHTFGETIHIYYTSLQFGEARITNGVIVAHGTKEKPVWDGYKETYRNKK